MKTSLREFFLKGFNLLFIILFITAMTTDAFSAVESVKATVKKPVKKTAKPAKKTTAAYPSEEKNAAEPAPAKKDDKVYDLGNITVVGEDKTKIKDASKKKVTYVASDIKGAKTEKAGSADFTASKTNGMTGEKEKESKITAFYEGMAGSYSTISSIGQVVIDNGPDSRSVLDLSASESGGYRFKSDHRDLGAAYGYSSEDADSTTKVKAAYRGGSRNLPGFDNFANSYMETEGALYSIGGKYSAKDNRFEIGLESLSKDIKIPAAISDKYDASLFTMGIAHDMVFENNPLTLELKLSSDGLEMANSQGSSKSSVIFGVNAERPVSEKFMVQINPEIAKNGDKSVKAGGTISAILKEKCSVSGKELTNKYKLTLGKTARKYDAISFLFPDDNTIVWAKSAAGANLFDANTYENDETFAELSAELNMSEDTKLKASYKNSKHNGLLYLTDLNSIDARSSFASFADGAKSNKFTVGAEHKLNEEMTADISAVSTSVSDGANDLMPYIPKTEYILGVSYKAKNGLEARVSEKFKGEMDSSKNPAANPKVPAYSSLGLDVSKNFNENGKILFRIDNLLNSDLKLHPNYAYHGRKFALGINYKY